MLLALPALLAAVTLAASACGGGAGTEVGEPPTPTVAPPPAPPSTEPPADERGVPPPAEAVEPPADDPLAGTTLEGESLGLTAFRGEYLFVNVWSSW